MHRLPHGVKLRLQDLHGIVLHIAGLRVNLRKFALSHARNAAQSVKQDGARTGRALVKR